MRLATRLTLAIGALVVATAGTVGLLAYRNIAAIAVPRTLVRAEAHVRILAGELENLVAYARADVMGFREVIGLDEVIALSRDPASGSAGGLTLEQWRARIARRFAAEMRAKPNYAQFRIIGVADGGREIVRVDRSGAAGSVRIVPDDELEPRGDRAYFTETIAAPDETVVVSPIELNRERGEVERPLQPVVRVSAPIYAPGDKPFGIITVNVDLRPAFARIGQATRPDTALYVVNERGDYLVHPDPQRTFGFELGTPFRIQNDFPGLSRAVATGEQHSALVEDRNGRGFGVGLASVRLAQGPRISVVETIPEEKIVSAALAAVRDSSLTGGTIAALCAIALAFVLARTLTRPLTEMTAAVQRFTPGAPLAVPTQAGGEIGVLARSFETMARDVDEKTAAIRRDAEIFESIMSTMAEAVLLIDRHGTILFANRANHEMLGPVDMAGTEWREAYEILQTDGITPLPKDQWPTSRALRGEQVDGYELVYRRRSSGKTIEVMGSARPFRDAAGEIAGAVVIFRDITGAKQIERQLHQSQKLDAIGQLTGGVAHDFNNMLTVITGTSEMLIEGLADRPNLLAIARLIDQAADRGAELTKHLLAFARKQPLQPREVDINTLVLESAKLLRPTLGEHIEIQSMLEDDLRSAHIDPAQLSTALLNLAVNARDAMPDGGKLTLETSNVVLDEAYAHSNAEVKPGVYVMVAVSDSGTGIPEELREKVFEPFFTTKAIGKGTGLGLSMVYGFVKQSNGHIKIYSEEGYGTTIRLYLPVADRQANAAAAATAPIERGTETILVVEDDALVRDFVVAQLRSLGYATVTAESGNAALALVEAGAAFDLLFTDVIMPGGMNGRQLAGEVAKRRPDVRVLYTSGYAENAIVHHGRLDAGVMLLAKPYRKTDLARMVRAALDKGTARAAAAPQPAARLRRG